MKNTIATALFVAAGIALAAPAAATTDDDVYIATIDTFGINYESEEAAIMVGKAVCQGFDNDMTVLKVGKIIVSETGISTSDAGTIMGAAVAAYCPEYKDVFES